MESITRHSRLVRFSHWLIAISGILLIFSGFGQMPMYKRYFITAIPGLSWSGDFAITLLLHYITAVLFIFGISFHMVFHGAMKEFAIMPKSGDLKKSLIGLKAMLGLAEDLPHGKFQAKQRVVYGIIGSVSLVLVITGLVKTYKNLGDIVLSTWFLQLMTMLHTFAAVFFVMLFVAHVGALLLKNHRPLIPSMITGKISKIYALKHHPAWKFD